MQHRSQYDQPFVVAPHAELVTPRCQVRPTPHGADLRETLSRIADSMNVGSLYEETITETITGEADRRLGAPCACASHVMCDTQFGADGAGKRHYETGIMQIVLLKTSLHCRAR